MEDIKAINLQLYNKLQECEGNLRLKTDHLSSLDQKTVQMSDSIRQLEAKYVEHQLDGPDIPMDGIEPDSNP